MDNEGPGLITSLEAMPDLPEAYPSLIARLVTASGGGSWAECERIRQRLTELGTAAKAAIPAFVKVLRDVDPDAGHRSFAHRQECLAASEALGRIGRDALPVLLDLLKEPHRFIRRDAVRAIGFIGSAAEDAVPAIRESFEHQEEYFRRLAIDNKFASYILRDARFCSRAREALDRIEEPSSDESRRRREEWPAAHEMFDWRTRLYQVRSWAGELDDLEPNWMGKLQGVSPSSLLSGLSSDHAEERCRSAHDLAMLTLHGDLDQSARTEIGSSVMLIRALRDGNQEVRRHAAGILWDVAVPVRDAVHGLLNTLFDEHAYVRQNALGALGRIRERVKQCPFPPALSEDSYIHCPNDAPAIRLTLGELRDRLPCLEIPNKPGWYRLDVSPAPELAHSIVNHVQARWLVLADWQAILIVPLDGGGLFSYVTQDGRLIHTLSVDEGIFNRELARLTGNLGLATGRSGAETSQDGA